MGLVAAIYLLPITVVFVLLCLLMPYAGLVVSVLVALLGHFGGLDDEGWHGLVPIPIAGVLLYAGVAATVVHVFRLLPRLRGGQERWTRTLALMVTVLIVTLVAYLWIRQDFSS
jgi:hypothetical protein